MGGDLGLGDKVAGQTPDFLLCQIAIFAVKDEIPIVVFAVGVLVDGMTASAVLNTQPTRYVLKKHSRTIGRCHKTVPEKR